MSSESSAIQIRQAAVDVGQRGGEEWSKERRDLVKRTVAPDATDAELEMFLHIASRSGLDPLRKQIHFMKHGGRVTIVADINGLQARAAREADFEGISHAVVYEGEEVIFNHAEQRVEKHTSNPFAPKGRILGAWAVVYRKGMRPFMDVSLFAEFNNSNNGNWKTKPAVMMDKVAKSRALRLAYPEQLGNIYEGSEVDMPERDTGMDASTLSKPVMPATTATRDAVPSLQHAEPEKVPVVVSGGAAAPKADVVDAETVPSREPGADDGEYADPVTDECEAIIYSAATVTQDGYAALAKRAAALPTGSEERKRAAKALREAHTRLNGGK